MGNGDIWQVNILPVVDFNGDEQANFQDFSIFSQYWRQNTSFVDIAPAPLGDAIVDSKDLEVLSQSWLKEVPPIGLVAHWRLDEVEGIIVRDSVGTHHGIFRVPGMPATDLVAHWTLDEGSGHTVADSSGGNHGGVLRGNPVWVQGVIGGALEFDGTDDFVDLGNPSDLPSGRSPRSLCVWAKTDSLSQDWRQAVSYGRPGLGEAMFIGRHGSTLYGGGYGDDVQRYGFWAIGEWHHICLTYDGTMARLYADGVRVASAAKNWNLVRERAYIGRQANDWPEFWDGPVDDVRIYNRVLSQSEIEPIMEGKVVPQNLDIPGMPRWQPTSGILDGALRFSGRAAYVSVPFVLDPSEGPFSIFAWVKQGAPGQAIVSQSGDDGGANWLSADPSAGTLMTELKPAGRRGKPLGSSTVITNGEWHRVGLVWDGAYRVLYVDGVGVSADTNPQTGLDGSTGGLYFSAANDLSPTGFWSGLLDDVRIYNRVVTP